MFTRSVFRCTLKNPFYARDLSIELDSVLQLARLPQDKVDRILRLLQLVPQENRHLDSLIGSLHHACLPSRGVCSYISSLHDWPLELLPSS